MKTKLKHVWRDFYNRFLFRRKLRFISWWYNRNRRKYCWPDCVSWAYNPYRINPFIIDSCRGCQIESEFSQSASCWCGAWNNGVFKKDANDQKVSIEKENTEPPF